jgi:hypothetical protein
MSGDFEVSSWGKRMLSFLVSFICCAYLRHIYWFISAHRSALSSSFTQKKIIFLCSILILLTVFLLELSLHYFLVAIWRITLRLRQVQCLQLQPWDMLRATCYFTYFNHTHCVSLQLCLLFQWYCLPHRGDPEYRPKGDGKCTPTTISWSLTSLSLSLIYIYIYINKQTPWSESATELHRPRDRRLSTKWLPTFADRGYHVVSVTDPYTHFLGFLDRSRYFSTK